jgi:hypothetical protein
VDTGKIGRKLLEKSDCRSLIVDEDTPFAGDLSSEDYAGIVGIDSILFEDVDRSFFEPGVNLENRRDYRAVSAKSDYIRRSLAPKQQGESIDQHRLASAGFPGEEVQSSTELNRNILYDSEVFKT